MSSNDLIVVQHFYDATELALARRYLEQAGIATQERDVRTLQTLSPLDARAVGGAKLLVAQTDYYEASRLLIEGGFMIYNPRPATFQWVERLDEWAQLLFGPTNVPREFRLVFMGFVLLSMLFSVVLVFLLLN